MIHLAWKQKSDGHILLFIPVENRVRAYSIESGVNNFLVSERKVQLSVRIGESAEKTFEADFEGLKLQAGKGGSQILKEVVDSETGTPVSSCAISRGEFYNDRWLNPDGWSENKCWFALIPEENPVVDSPVVIPERPVQVTAETKVAAVIEKKAQAPFPEGPEGSIKKTGRHYRLFILFTVTSGLFGYFVQIASANPEPTSVQAFFHFAFGCLFLMSVAGSVICFLSLVYRSWKQLQSAGVKMHPEMAVWLLLIPVYNFYWAFKAITGLFAATNRVAAAMDPPPPKKLLKPALANVFCITGISFCDLLFIYYYCHQTGGDCGLIPYLIYFSALLFCLFYLIVGTKLKSAFNRIARQKM